MAAGGRGGAEGHAEEGSGGDQGATGGRDVAELRERGRALGCERHEYRAYARRASRVLPGIHLDSGNSTFYI